jgi:glycine/D-amino acid oxidase-like deaminating enzyme
MKNQSYWIDTAPPFAAASAGAVEGRADVVVIGGGFTGLSAALALAKQNARVVLLEAGRVVNEASGRNGGQCSNGTAHSFLALREQFGHERARELYRAFDAAVDTVEGIVHGESIDCDFTRSGKIKLAAKPHHFASLTKLYDALKPDIEPDMVLVPPERVRDEIQSDQFYGGLIQPHSAQMHMGKFGAGLAAAAQRHGARIFEHTPVTGLKRTGTRSYRVTTPRGSIEAAQVIVATGCSRSGPLSWFRRRMTPVGSFIVVTEPLPPELLHSLLPKQRNYVTTRIIGNYFRSTPDGRLLFGGRARFAISNPLSDQKSGEVLRAAMSQLFPPLADVRLDYCWGGLVDMTADRLPRVGEHEGLLYAMGYSGHGTQMSVHMGQLLAELAAGHAAVNPFRQLKWRAIPAHFGGTWYLPLVGAYYKFKDARS